MRLKTLYQTFESNLGYLKLSCIESRSFQKEGCKRKFVGRNEGKKDIFFLDLVQLKSVQNLFYCYSFIKNKMKNYVSVSSLIKLYYLTELFHFKYFISHNINACKHLCPSETRKGSLSDRVRGSTRCANKCRKNREIQSFKSPQ